MYNRTTTLYVFFYWFIIKNTSIIILVPFYEKDISNASKINVIFCIFNIVVVHNSTPSNAATIELSSKCTDPVRKPHQPHNFSFPKKKIGQWNRSFKANWFNDFPWLHYVEESDSVICYVCAHQNKKGNLSNAKNKELTFIKGGYSNWKNAIARFQEHQKSNCHILACEHQVGVIASSGNIIEMCSNAADTTMKQNRTCFLKIIESVRFLARQGLAMQGHTDAESNFNQLLKLRANDVPLLTDWLQRKNDKYTYHEIQTELVSIMADIVSRQLVTSLDNSFFSILCDEYTDVSNKEQLTLCVRWIDKELEAHEDFLGFVNIPNIRADTIEAVIKDVFIRLGLSFSNCRGQCYDGASNMLGSKSGVATRILQIQPKAHPTHCHGHSLSLGIKDVTKASKILSNTMDTAKEITTLIKYSPKRECSLGQIKENLEQEDESDSAACGGIVSLCPTRWTVRAACFRRILDNYSALMEEWRVSLEDKLQPDVRGRIVGCQAQMQTFDFFFGLSLGERLFSHSDNLSKTLQSTRMSAVSGQRLAQLTKSVLESIRNDDSFSAFYSIVLRKSKDHAISDPLLPRKRRAPARIEVGSGQPTFPETPKDHYRRIYFEAIDLIVNAIEQRFSQPSFTAYEKMESLLLKGINGESYTAELDYMKVSYKDDINFDSLKAQLQVLRQILKDKGAMECFDDVLCEVKKLPKEERSLIGEVVILCKLLAVNPATSACCERSFSAARRLKTWLRSNMKQQRFSNLTVLNCHKKLTESLDVIQIANTFAGRNENRMKNFGIFTNADL